MASFLVLGFVLLYVSSAVVLVNLIEPEQGSATTSARTVSDASASNGQALQFGGNLATPTPGGGGSNFQQNLDMIMSVPAKWRNTTWQDSPYLETPSDQLPVDALLGSRSDLNGPDDAVHNQVFFAGGSEGQFRTMCEFSHFAYDDPIVYPNQPGKAHLHMFFGNTYASAYFGTGHVFDAGSNSMVGPNDMLNRGGSTCNGHELNRSGYWAPALFDAQGNVRVPRKILVYYKLYPGSPGTGVVYPDGMRMVSDTQTMYGIQELNSQGRGADGVYAFKCNNNTNGARSNATKDAIPVCSSDGKDPDDAQAKTLEVDVLLPNCWNGNPDVTNYKDNLRHYSHPCQYFHDGNSFPFEPDDPNNPHDIQLPNIEYKIIYPLLPGETTAGWFLSSDVDKATGQFNAGKTLHGDWWSGWHKGINKEWVDNCNNIRGADCAVSWLNAQATRVLKVREQYSGEYKIPGAELFGYICKSGKTISKPADLAYCNP